MCGFIGCVVKTRKVDSLLDCALKMMVHRGPDHSAFDEDRVNDYFLYLGHTRLSIIDLTERASQPFHSFCGRYSLVYNGEIYNYKELREDLEKLGHVFATESDTEVLLIALVEWGLASLKRFVGMFSFVFYNRPSQELTLVRDAFGIKPLLYALKDNELYFASELRPLLHLREESAKPNLQRAYDYLVHGDYDSSDQSFVEGIKHLPPAHYLTFDLQTGQATVLLPWWKPNLSENTSLTFGEAVEQLRELFLDSVKLHLRSDVPLGVALSGGIDSSAIASAVRYLEPNMQLNTFSYVASDAQISEEKWIDLLNKKMSAQPYKVTVNQSEMQADLDEMLLKQGEPFGSTSIYAQYRVFQLCKESGVTVTLEGQGADELLAGYWGYPGHRLLSLIETKGWLAAHQYAKRWAQSPGRSYALAWQYLGRVKFPDWLYALLRKRMGRNFQPPWLNIHYLAERNVHFMETRPPLHSQNHGKRVKEALANSLMHRGLPSLLRHGDRNSMAFSIESRVPFLTLPLANFLLSLPEHYMISDEGVTKHIFREAMRGIVPDIHLNRKDKIGFATPEVTWLLNMTDVIRGWIYQAPDLPFLNKEALLVEYEEIVQGKRVFNSQVWRWINYLRWSTLVDMK